MIKKRILIVLAVVSALVVPISAFAAISNNPSAKNIRSFFRLDITKLTDAQKADVTTYTQKSADLHKEFVNKMVANGSMTQEQGDAQLKMIDEKLKNGGENGLLPELGMGRGGRGGKELGGRGGRGGRGEPGRPEQEMFDVSKLTEQQKADLMDVYKKMADQQKSNITKMVNDNLMTKEQGDSQAKKIDEMTANIGKDNSFRGMGMFMGGFGGPNHGNGTNPSTLTEQQKADLAENSKNMVDLQKELINKMVSNGAMTKEQGDLAIQRMDNMGKMQSKKSFSKGDGMRQGAGSGHGNMNGNGRTKGNRAPNAGTSSNSTPTPNVNTTAE